MQARYKIEEQYEIAGEYMAYCGIIYHNIRGPIGSTGWLTMHPAPSWKLVAIAPWNIGEHGILEELQNMYLKGKLCAHAQLYISEVKIGIACMCIM